MAERNEVFLTNRIVRAGSIGTGESEVKLLK